MTSFFLQFSVIVRFFSVKLKTFYTNFSFSTSTMRIKEAAFGDVPKKKCSKNM